MISRKRQRSADQRMKMEPRTLPLFATAFALSGAVRTTGSFVIPGATSPRINFKRLGLDSAPKEKNTVFYRRTHSLPTLPFTSSFHSPDPNSRSPSVPSLGMISALLDGLALDDFMEGHDVNDDIETMEDVSEKIRQLSQQVKLSSPAVEGLSKFHRNILSQTHSRQRFVTGKDPLLVKVSESATRKWLGSSATQIFVNGTTVDNSLASFDRFQWIDDMEREELVDKYAMISMELIGEIHMKKPGYVHVLPSQGAGHSAARRRIVQHSDSWFKNSILYDQIEANEEGSLSEHDRVWVTGFSLAGSQGFLHSVDSDSGEIASVTSQTSKSLLWPNESNVVPKSVLDSATGGTEPGSVVAEDRLSDALLVSDGFLVPGKNKGGLHIVKNPGNPLIEQTVCLTGGATAEEDWFYHRAVWIDGLKGHGKSILTARAKMTNVMSQEDAGSVKSQLVWLEVPEPHHYCELTGEGLEQDGTAFDPLAVHHLPWKSHVLDEGPDVMFTVADLDTEDDTIEVIASQFFSRKITLHSIQRGPDPKVVFSRTLDDNCGAAFGAVLADLDGAINADPTRVVIDSGSTVETRKHGDSFSHVLITSHECSFSEDTSSKTEKELSRSQDHRKTLTYEPEECNVDGGSLFAFRVPEGKDAWKTEPWVRTTVASGFTVRGQLGNMINPGAPGFVYTFHPKKDDAIKRDRRPLIAVAGDCSESAYLFRPVDPEGDNDSIDQDPNARYKLMCEIECGATVGSIGVGYNNFFNVQQEEDYAKLYIPCFEKDKVLVFALGSGEDFADAGMSI